MSDLDYQLNWERIFGAQTPRGLLYMLPSETAAVIVQHDPDFRITSLIPPATRNIKTNYKGLTAERQHQTPFLLFSHVSFFRSGCDPYNCFVEVNDKVIDSLRHPPWCHCQPCSDLYYRSSRVGNNFYLFAVNPITEDFIQAQPYRIFNVYPEGDCCFTKSSFARTPKNLQQAHSRFWMDYFSDEFMPKPIKHQCQRKRHYDTIHAPENCSCACCANLCICPCRCDLSQEFADLVANYAPDERAWEDYTRMICGDQFLSHPKGAEAIFISHDPGLLKTVPEKFHKRTPKKFRGADRFLIGLASNSDNKWDIDLLGLQFTLNRHQVDIVN